MKKYLIIGEENTINENYDENFFKDNEVYIIDYFNKIDFWDKSFKNIKSKKKNNYVLYKQKIDDLSFEKTLYNIKPDYIIFGINTMLKRINIFDFIEILTFFNKQKEVKYVFFIPAYKEYNNILYYDTFEKLIRNNKLNALIFKVSNIIGNNIFGSLVAKRIKCICNKTTMLPFPNLEYQDSYLNNYIGIQDICRISLLVIKDIDVLNFNKTYNLYNKEKISLRILDDKIIKYFKLEKYYTSDKIKYKKGETMIDNFSNYIDYKFSSFDHEIDKSLNWYRKNFEIGKLTKNIKNKIDQCNKNELKIMLNIYNQHKLLNEEIINYIKIKLI